MAYTLGDVSWDVFFEHLAQEEILGDMGVIDFPFINDQRMTGSSPRLKKWFPTIDMEVLPAVLRAMYNCLKPLTHCYVFVPKWRELSNIVSMAEHAGFMVANRLIWDHIYKGMGYSWRDSHTDILFCKKGRRALNHAGGRDVLSYPKVTCGYPTEKPVGLAEELILNSSRPNDIIVDPFMGSGVFGQVAIRNGRRFMGTDINPDAFEEANERAYNAVAGVSAFVHAFGIEREQLVLPGDPAYPKRKSIYGEQGKKPPINSQHQGARGKT